jgi:hypothetical protein
MCILNSATVCGLLRSIRVNKSMRWAGHLARMGVLRIHLVDNLEGDYLKHLCVIFRDYKGKKWNGLFWI